jgi:hypothetical protein
MTGRMALTCFGSSGCQNSESGYCGEQCNQEFHDRASGWILICWRMLRTFYQTGRKFLYSGGTNFLIPPIDSSLFNPANTGGVPIV